MSHDTSEQFDKKACNELRVGNILVIETGGRYEYIKVGTITTAKPGKHGSAKYMIKGSNIQTKKTHETSFISGSKVDTAKLKRTEYVLVDIYGDEMSVMGRGAEEGSFETLKISEFSEKDVELLKSVMDPDSKEEVTFALISAPRLCMVEDVRKGGKVVQKE